MCCSLDLAQGIKFTENIIADPDLANACTDATLLVFVLPHQFLGRICPQMTTMANGCRALSLIKGIEFEEGGPILISNMIKDAMSGMDVSVLMGANVANEVAKGDFAEATIGCDSKENGAKWCKLFNTDDFSVTAVPDVAGAELCGALKNVVALGAGFCDGVGFGGNTKAAIIRIGLKEMATFCDLFYGDRNIQKETLLESCGLADLVTTCFGGRNRKCAEIFAKNIKAGTKKDWATIETEELNGQKLQGTGTCEDVMTAIKAKNAEKKFPLFCKIHKIAFEGDAPEKLIEVGQATKYY